MDKPIESLAQSVPSWGAKLAFGEPVTAGGREMTPAALVVFGFGGGGGSGRWPQRAESPEGSHQSEPEGEGEGSGGGGGGYVLPLGAYVSGPNGPRFKPNPVAIIIVSVPLVSALGWALARIITAARS
ncbi:MULTISPECIES: hypothetical protein [Microbacterium]|uniref:hypothetical protein n=1 Tax=Microbacterium TaxID=33882 RepID=UPI000D65669B|nr:MULTISPECIES: hypothetical protein [Microbacterium]